MKTVCGLLASVAAFFLMLISDCLAQSTVISTPGSFDSPVSERTMIAGNAIAPVSLSARIKAWEQILAEPHVQIRGTMTTRSLLEQLESIGLPVSLDESAIDDSCSLDEPISLGLLSLPLYERLSSALKLVNADIALANEQLSICSLDVLSDPEFFCRMVYDISRLDAHPQEIVQVIRNSIDPDGWDDTNGDGTIEVLQTNGRRMLIVSQTYAVQHRVRRLFASIERTIGSLPSRVGAPQFSTSGGPYQSSSSVRVPKSDDQKAQIVLQNGRRTPAPATGGIF